MAWPVFSAIAGIVTIVVDGVKEDRKQKAAIKKAKVDGEIQAIQTASTNLADWEKIQAKASANSWKDEYWTIILSIPAIMAFIPGLGVYVTEGFAALGDMPEWYQYMLLIAIGASFGVKMTNKAKTLLKGG